MEKEKYMVVIDGHGHVINKSELVSYALCRGFDDFETKKNDGLYKYNEDIRRYKICK